MWTWAAPQVVFVVFCLDMPLVALACKGGLAYERVKWPFLPFLTPRKNGL